MEGALASTAAASRGSCGLSTENAPVAHEDVVRVQVPGGFGAVRARGGTQAVKPLSLHGGYAASSPTWYSKKTKLRSPLESIMPCSIRTTSRALEALYVMLGLDGRGSGWKDLARG